MRKTRTTDQLLTLGMALTTDKRAMERRVRGVFARKKSAKGVIALALILALVLGVAAFTTACQPGKAPQALTPIPVEQEASSAQQGESEESAAEEPDSTTAPMQWKSEQYLIGSMVESPFQYPISPAHIDEPAYELANGVSVHVNADVTIPQATGYGFRQCYADWFTLEDYQTMINYFLPDAKWVPNQTEPGFQTNGAYELADIDFSKRTTLSVEQDGTLYSVTMGAEQHTFGFQRSVGMVYREGYLLGDVEMEQQFGQEIRAPIDLTRETAQAKADQVLADLDIQGWQLDLVERACMFESGNTGNVLTRGWDFVYMLSNAGLPVHYYSGSIGMDQDPLDYCGVFSGALAIYVDEYGVSRLYWDKYYDAGSALFTNIEIIGVDGVLSLAKGRLARTFGQRDLDVKEIELYAIRLASMLIGYSDEMDSDVFEFEQRDMAHMIPTWDVSCCLTYMDGRIEYITMPFCATDGGCVTMR